MNARNRAAVALVNLLFAFSLAVGTAAAAGPPAPLVFHAARSGEQTLDEGAGGGNPFASALIELMSRGDLTLEGFPSELRQLTWQKSSAFQSPDVPDRVQPASWMFQRKPADGTRVALVVVFSEYSAPGAQSLPGAKHDAGRVGAALAAVGFQTEIVVDPTRAELNDVLRRFTERSAGAESALVYTTGHGVEVNGVVYVLPGDYPVSEKEKALERKAIRLSRLALAARAKQVNLVFYGGCRDNPFAPKKP